MIGLVDGTLIPLQATPSGPDGGSYRCRKGGYPAINALCAIDHRGAISYINAEFKSLISY